MKTTQVRLLYPSNVKTADVQAVLRGISSLGKFGVLVDHSTIDRKAIRPVRLGRYLRRIMEAEGPQTVDFKAFGVRLADIFAISNKDVLGFGLMVPELFLIDKDGKEQHPSIGAGRYNDVALLSLFGFEEIKEPNMRLRAIEVAARHEAGHLFRKGHCAEPSCVMQEKPVRIESMIFKREFCRTCEGQIQANVNLREYELNHIAGVG